MKWMSNYFLQKCMNIITYSSLRCWSGQWSGISTQLISFTNPRMYLFHIPQCTIQNISVLNGKLRDVEQVYCGISEICLLCISFPPFIITMTGGFPSHRASNAESVSISWRHHVLVRCWTTWVESLLHLSNHLTDREELNMMTSCFPS